MIILDTDATFVKLDKLRERMTRLELAPNETEWQYTRLLIQAVTEGVMKSRKCSPTTRKIRIDAPEAVHGDWQELVLALGKKGIPSQSRRSALQQERTAAR